MVNVSRKFVQGCKLSLDTLQTDQTLAMDKINSFVKVDHFSHDSGLQFLNV